LREIKFRVWDENNKIMKKEVRGTFDLLIDMNGKLHQSMKTSFDTTLISVTFPDALIIMQYTGIKDKNGKDIYEGDVVAWTALNAIVIYGIIFYLADNAQFIVTWNDGNSNALGKEWSSHYEAIGNIHENPELMESKV